MQAEIFICKMIPYSLTCLNTNLIDIVKGLFQLGQILFVVNGYVEEDMMVHTLVPCADRNIRISRLKL